MLNRHLKQLDNPDILENFDEKFLQTTNRDVSSDLMPVRYYEQPDYRGVSENFDFGENLFQTTDGDFSFDSRTFTGAKV